MRTPLPPRRRSMTLQAVHVEPGVGMHHFLLTIGYDPEGRAREAFASGHREGSALAHLMSDACVLISIMLQHDIPIDAIGHSLGTVPLGAEVTDGETPASLIGTIVGYLREFESEEMAAQAVMEAEARMAA